jgi:phage shock protein A
MNRDYPLAPSIFGNENDKINRLRRKENKLVDKAKQAVDEGRDKKADRLFGRAARVEDRKIKLSEKK